MAMDKVVSSPDIMAHLCALDRGMMAIYLSRCSAGAFSGSGDIAKQKGGNLKAELAGQFRRWYKEKLKALKLDEASLDNVPDDSLQFMDRPRGCPHHPYGSWGAIRGAFMYRCMHS